MVCIFTIREVNTLCFCCKDTAIMWHVNCSFGTDDASCLVLEIALKTSKKVTLNGPQTVKGLKHIYIKYIYIYVCVLIWEKLKADISLWSCWRQTWLNGDGFEHRLFFSISVWLRTFFQLCTWTYLPYLVYKIRKKRMVLVPNFGCLTWFTKYGTKERCLFQIWESTVKQIKKAKLMWVCKDVYRSTGESTPKTWLWMVGYSKCWQHRYSAVVGCKNKKAKELI